MDSVDSVALVTVDVVDGAVTSELRRAVLRPAWPVGARMHGDDAAESVHLAARTADGTVVGAAVLLPAPYPPRPDAPAAWQLRGMASAETVRGRGVGALVVEEAVRQVRARGGRLLWCQAREQAIAFYARHGFVGDGEMFNHPETGIVHRLMYRELFREAGPSDH